MLPEDIDDLFRDKLAGHASPPGEALWARLNAGADPGAEIPANTEAERLDQLFRQGLNAHATPPGRALWERLEDEHLRPRQRRPAAWWPMALAAAVALLLVAGGAGLWLGFPTGKTHSDAVASRGSRRGKPAGHQLNTGATGAASPITAPQPNAATAASAAENRPALIATILAPTAQQTAPATFQKKTTAQATRLAGPASTAPKAGMAAAGPSLRHPLGTNRRPDAAAGHRPLVARTTPRPAPTLAPPTAADEPQPAPKPAAVSTLALSPKPTPAAEIVPAPPAAISGLALASEVITVDVRKGAARPAKTAGPALAETEAPAERRRLGGRLLQQAGHLVRGERVSLAEATGLPENVTLRATVAGRSITKSIQL